MQEIVRNYGFSVFFYKNTRINIGFSRKAVVVSGADKGTERYVAQKYGKRIICQNGCLIGI